jgi:hypothetical protein
MREAPPMTIEELYSSQIKMLSLEDRLRLAERIIADAVPGEAGRGCRSLLDLEGLGEDLWRGIDAQQYVNELRGEWEMRG